MIEECRRMRNAGDCIKFFIKQCVKMISQNVLLPFLYFIYSRKKVEKGKTIFADAHHNHCPPSMELLRAEWERRGYPIVDIYLDYQKNSYGKVFKSMLTFMKQYATASFVVICDNFLPVTAGKKRRETTVIQLWHGCGAFKKFGYDSKEDIPPYYKGKVYHNYDIVTVSSPACCKAFASAMSLPPSCILPIGISRTDKYYEPRLILQAKEKFFKEYPQAAGKKVVLYAPTFRGNAARPELNMEAEAVEALRQLGEQWYVIVKRHPHMEGEKKAKGLTTEEILPFADVLVSDYSSVIFDYCIWNRPIIFYAPDLKEYEGKRGFYLNYSELPGSIVTSPKRLKEAVEEPDAYVLQRKEFFLKYMKNCDGKVTVRLADYMEKRLR